ncbi:MAG TPA: hypothetical protein IGS52_17820 [Oscillatoriaceae cyanobacterium M33_DOE_052]|uniref:Uncharacterized protein n=1 Tax=Planktothricoides sp. SpSt-374 TaxID=2282167 RepID=A0A7C3VQ82_9CYAN|nr:hypothetical protein [Oscillatoriaceae cyanobacterium M33_DOE_052]
MQGGPRNRVSSLSLGEDAEVIAETRFLNQVSLSPRLPVSWSPRPPVRLSVGFRSSTQPTF